MQNTPFNAPEQAAISPFDPSRDHSAQLTRRTYNLIMGGLVTAGFAVIAACALLAQAPAFLYAVVDNYLAISIGSFIASIAGIAVMHMGMKREGYGVTLAGYALLVCSIGFTTGMVLPFYSLPSIANAFVGTFIISALFTLLGTSFPTFFARIQGIAVTALIALIVAGIAGSLMGFAMAWYDYAVILVFCGFIGYDTYRAQQCEPTVKMAILNAAEIWLDLVNIFIHLLQIVGDRD